METVLKELAMTIRPEELGIAVREARVSHAWTQDELAERVGASREWVSRLERGRSERMEVGMVFLAMDELGFTLTAPEGVSSGTTLTRRRVSARSKELLLAEIEKGQQLAGHAPSTEALDMAGRIIDGDLDVADAKSAHHRKHRSQ